MTLEMIKRNYDRKIWNEEMVAVAVRKRIITAAEYKEITGQKYKA